uniref:Uncharacterized protein n=1 Tax=Trieres chinensis TaxID=1514140 RepID=A0A7S1ZUH1_TRICV|mmetsp:Transcript_33520/g.68468  ORF Transcript_33520/g.68468 Transcript_33520/m.68468 type:complete len:206 (+) Transcript_33520:130-747(+)
MFSQMKEFVFGLFAPLWYSGYFWHFMLMAPVFIPFLISPFLPVRSKAKAVVEVDCSSKKIWEVLTEDPSKCTIGPLGGNMDQQVKELEIITKGKDGVTEWKESFREGNVVTTVTTAEASKGKGRIVREMTTSGANMSAYWMYDIKKMGEKRCRITLSGHTDIKSGHWTTYVFRFSSWVTGGPKKGMVDHLNLVTEAAGAKRKWIS